MTTLAFNELMIDLVILLFIAGWLLKNEKMFFEKQWTKLITLNNFNFAIWYSLIERLNFISWEKEEEISSESLLSFQRIVNQRFVCA